jgi:hypothetical protein
MKQNNNKLSNEFRAQVREHFGISEYQQFYDDYRELEEIAASDFTFVYNNFDKVCDVRFGDSRSNEEPQVQIYAREDCDLAVLRFENASEIRKEAIDREEARDAVDEILSYEVGHWVSEDGYSEGRVTIFEGDVEEDLTVRTDEIGVTEDIEQIVESFSSE